VFYGIANKSPIHEV